MKGQELAADAALIAALATGATRQEAATRAGLSKTTVYRRLADPAFRRRVSAAWSELIDAAVGRLADATTEACQTLRDLLGADSESVRLAAARGILELAHKYHESAELAERIAVLEERFGQPEGPRRWAG